MLFKETPRWKTRPSWKEFTRPWFAWYPVKLSNGDVVWLQTVFRRYSYYKVQWEYTMPFHQEPSETAIELIADYLSRGKHEIE